MTTHLSGADLVTAATSIRVALRQLNHATSRGEWSNDTLALAVEIQAGLQANFQAVEALAHRAANKTEEDAL